MKHAQTSKRPHDGNRRVTSGWEIEQMFIQPTPLLPERCHKLNLTRIRAQVREGESKRRVVAWFRSPFDPGSKRIKWLETSKVSTGLAMRNLRRRDARRNVKGKKTKQTTKPKKLKKPARAMGACASVCSHPTLLRTSRWFSLKFHNRFLLQGFENKREPAPLGINEPP